MRTTEMIVLDNGQEAGAFLENGVYIETGPHKHAVQQTFFLTHGSPPIEQYTGPRSQ